jgi:hypothetical protein
MNALSQGGLVSFEGLMGYLNPDDNTIRARLAETKKKLEAAAMKAGASSLTATEVPPVLHSACSTSEWSGVR